MIKDILMNLKPEDIEKLQAKSGEFLKMLSEKLPMIRGLEETFRLKNSIPEDEIFIYSALPVIMENPEENDIIVYAFSVKNIEKEIVTPEITIPAGSMLVTNQAFKFNLLSYVRELSQKGIKGVMDLFLDENV